MKSNSPSASIFSLIAALTLSCCSKPQQTRDLGRCWSVNTTQPGPVRGEGVFINASPHGYGLVAPDCDERGGNNTYKLTRRADEQLRSSQIAKFGEYSGFVFDGVVVKSPTGNILIIRHFDGFFKTRQPDWIAQLYKKAGLPTN
ncbi:MAG: hypothetical protein ACKOUT_13745 [Novosphingobium sp.]